MTSPSKDSVRRELRERLRALPPDARGSAALAAEARVWTVPEVAAARVLLLYAHLPGEVPTDAIAREAMRRGATVVYPRCVTGTRTLTLHALERLEALREGAYGIREPDETACPLVDVGAVDAALVPGLGWDRAGGRIGRGAGYYDRLFALPEWRGFRCGVFFAAQEVPALPADPWDVPLEAVVTEGGVLRGGETALSPPTPLPRYSPGEGGDV